MRRICYNCGKEFETESKEATICGNCTKLYNKPTSNAYNRDIGVFLKLTASILCRRIRILHNILWIDLKMDLVDKIIAFETGEMNDHDLIDFFAELIKSGQCWSLQGMYGRTAKRLIDAKYISSDGNVLKSMPAINAIKKLQAIKANDSITDKAKRFKAHGVVEQLLIENGFVETSRLYREILGDEAKP